MGNSNNPIWSKDNGTTLQEHISDILEAFSKLSNKIKVNDNLKTAIETAIKLHDLGKALPYFQIVSVGNKSYEPFDVNKDLNIYHSLASVLFINQEKLKETFSDDENMTRYVLSAIAYHHWKNSLENDLRFGTEKFEYLKNTKVLEQLLNNLTQELKNKNIQDVIQINKEMLEGLANGLSFTDYVVPPYQMYWLPKRIETDEEGKKKCVLISGFLQRCDHYASFCEEDSSSNIEQIELSYGDDLDVANKIKNKISEKIGGQNNITFWQEEKLNNNRLKDQNLILLAPTGSGKTEFAFIWSNNEKFFYTLPLRAAVEQIYDRAKAIFGEDKTGLLHSDADVYLLGDEYNYEKIKVYEVAKQLSYPVIISTGDQFFPYGLRPPGYERIYATFSYSRLVIDEIQAYDPRACAIIVKYIEDIVRLGGKFLLMTATLPEYVKQEIEKRIASDNSYKELNIYDAERNKYEELKKHKIDFKLISNKKYGKKIDFSIPDNIIDKIIRNAQDKRILVILNTVRQAKNVHEKICNKIKNSNNILKDKNIILFHSQFTLNEKQNIKQEIEEKFKNPKDSNDDEGKILVATQVVEAAIDIDADILYTEICPMDSLVQRMGRVLRRYKEGFSFQENAEPNVFVWIFKEGYESGNGRVYDKELIEKTLILLKENSNQNNYWNNYYDNFNKEKEKLKKIDIIIPTDKFLLSEYQKFNIVSELYKSLNPSGKYLSKFYETLSIFDAGFMSDRKEEAQRIFREIINASVIESSKKNSFKEKVEKLIQDNDFNYTKFKKEIIAEFVIQIPYYDLDKRQRGSVVSWIDKIQIENETDENKKRKEKLKKWCEDIFVVENDNNKNKWEQYNSEIENII
jgi:CRISPR-associated endonuclease/helicase Cas3